MSSAGERLWFASTRSALVDTVSARLEAFRALPTTPLRPDLRLEEPMPRANALGVTKGRPGTIGKTRPRGVLLNEATSGTSPPDFGTESRESAGLARAPRPEIRARFRAQNALTAPRWTEGRGARAMTRRAEPDGGEPGFGERSERVSGLVERIRRIVGKGASPSPCRPWVFENDEQRRAFGPRATRVPGDVRSSPSKRNRCSTRRMRVMSRTRRRCRGRCRPRGACLAKRAISRCARAADSTRGRARG